jgi:hypothetical protein
VEQLCPHHEQCSFFINYGRRTSRMWKNLIALYCRGGLMPLCSMNHRYSEGEFCCDENLLPNGEQIPNPFHGLP